MKKIILIILAIFYMAGCAGKDINKAGAIQMQKQDAQKAWMELDHQ